MTTGPILLTAIVGASVSFLVTVLYHLLREKSAKTHRGSDPRPEGGEIWE